jgi:parallel beta-helix repeat protein
MLTLAFNIQPVKAEPRTWIVDDDGPADFHTIQQAINAASSGDTILVRNGTYTNYTFPFPWSTMAYGVFINKTAISLIAEESGTVVIEAPKTLPYPPFFRGIEVRSNDCIIQGFTIVLHDIPSWGNEMSGIWMLDAVNCIVKRNTIIGNKDNSGIGIQYAYNCTVLGNTIVDCYDTGIYNFGDYSQILGNNITNCKGPLPNGGFAIELFANHSRVIGNNLADNEVGILAGSYGIGTGEFPDIFNATIYHNNFVNNHIQVVNNTRVPQTWDPGYPSGGNYWSDYTGVDEKRGPSQDQPGSDGIGDTPYVIDDYNQDNYPLMSPWTPPHDIAVINVLPSKTVVGQGCTTFIMITVENQGDLTETFNVTAYYNQTAIMIEQWSDGTNSQTFWGMGDVNRDGYIDHWDIYTIGRAFGTTPGHPRWNPDADINSDGKIDARDTAHAEKNYGRDIWAFLGLPKLIQNQKVVTLPSGNSAVITFKWNTTGVVKGNYTISATTSNITGEIDTADNNFIGGWIAIAILGDINVDGTVNIIDIAIVAKAYGSNFYIGDPRWNPNADVDNSADVDIIDIATIARNFGKKA